MTDEQRVKEPIEIPCPHCQAKAGQKCFEDQFGVYQHTFHNARIDAASRLPKATTDHEFVWRADSEQCSVCGENHHGCIIAKQPSVPPVDEGEAPPQTFEEWWDEEIRLAQIHIGSGDYWVSKGIAEKAWNAAKASSPAVAGGESETVLDAAIIRVLEQRCERGTDWDKAVLACADALRRLKHGERAEHETQPLIKDVRGKE